MKKTYRIERRSIVKLLELMLDNQEYFNRGLCIWARNLEYANLINSHEMEILSDYIERNRPSKFKSFYSIINRNPRYYWSKGILKPRVKWVKKHIHKIKQQEQ